MKFVAILERAVHTCRLSIDGDSTNIALADT
jgi:hypothetical protein